MTHIHVWKSKDGWRWRLINSNGRIMAESGEGYTRAYDAERAWGKVAEIAVLGVTVVRDKKPRRTRRKVAS